MIKVCIAGEGPNELGARSAAAPAGTATAGAPGVIEALLRRVRPAGWVVDHTIPWRSIRKYVTGAARGPAGDDHAVRKLTILAYERACEVLAFVRDEDGDPERAVAIAAALREAPELADGRGYALSVVGGVASPSIEAWILWLHCGAPPAGYRRGAIDRALTEAGIAVKDTAAYVAVIDGATLPAGDGDLPAWLAAARAALDAAIDGAPPAR